MMRVWHQIVPLSTSCPKKTYFGDTEEDILLNKYYGIWPSYLRLATTVLHHEGYETFTIIVDSNNNRRCYLKTNIFNILKLLKPFAEAVHGDFF